MVRHASANGHFSKASLQIAWRKGRCMNNQCTMTAGVYDEIMPEPFFEVLEHPADIGFRAVADTRAALFVHAALAMLSIAGDPEMAEPVQGFPITVTSADPESLMVDWLNEVLYWYDGKQVAFRDFRVTDLHDNSIEAIGIGEP